MHCHLLPNIDDGFVKWEELKSYFGLYRKCGFSGVVFTPHLYDPYVHTDVAALRDAWAKASAMAEEEGLFSSLASEVYVSNGGAIKGIPVLGRYMLTEFSIEYAPNDFIERLKALSPIIPIIAHVERYRWLTPRSPLLEEMRKEGFLIQVNGKALKKGGTAKEYVDAGLVDLFASDCHGKREDIVDLAEMISSHPDIMSKMSQMARHLKEVV